jgi:ABC-type multidrug transport system fused ATPase/permease subunit
MNNTMSKFYAFFRRYRKLVKLIDRKTKTSSVVKSVFSSFLMSLLIVLLPVLVVVNMFIYTKLIFILSIVMVILIMIWCILYYAFFYFFLKKYHPEVESINTKIPQWTEAVISSLFFLLLGIIVIATVL